MAVDGGTLAPRRVKDLLRFLTCGSVDDGKSTLIGRLLYDCALILDDQLAALERESRRFGTTGGDLDLSLLLDGLKTSGSNELRSMWPTGSSQRRNGPSSSPTHLGTSSTRAIWRPVRRPPISQ